MSDGNLFDNTIFDGGTKTVETDEGESRTREILEIVRVFRVS